MSNLLSFVNPLEFMLRYTVVVGTVICMVGIALCMLAKPLTLKKRGVDELNKKDSIYTGLIITGLCLIMVGMIIIALPVNATMYKI